MLTGETENGVVGGPLPALLDTPPGPPCRRPITADPASAERSRAAARAGDSEATVRPRPPGLRP